jgi:hypothetical protein
LTLLQKDMVVIEELIEILTPKGGFELFAEI